MFRVHGAGVIPPELGRLSSLHRLQLTGNRLSGVLWAWLASRYEPMSHRVCPPRLVRTTWRSFGLYLKPVPSRSTSGADDGCAYLDAHDSLDFSFFFAGRIPPELDQLATVKGLHLDGNLLSGEAFL